MNRTTLYRHLKKTDAVSARSEASTATDGLPGPARRWLTESGWHTKPTLRCPDHV